MAHDSQIYLAKVGSRPTLAMIFCLTNFSLLIYSYSVPLNRELAVAKLLVRFKPNTSRDWVLERMFKIGISETQITSRYFSLTHRAEVSIPDEDELKYSRAIRLISPQIMQIINIPRGA